MEQITGKLRAGGIRQGGEVSARRTNDTVMRRKPVVGSGSPCLILPPQPLHSWAGIVLTLGDATMVTTPPVFISKGFLPFSFLQWLLHHKLNTIIHSNQKVKSYKLQFWELSYSDTKMEGCSPYYSTKSSHIFFAPWHSDMLNASNSVCVCTCMLRQKPSKINNQYVF